MVLKDKARNTPAGCLITRERQRGFNNTSYAPAAPWDFFRGCQRLWACLKQRGWPGWPQVLCGDTPSTPPTPNFSSGRPESPHSFRSVQRDGWKGPPAGVSQVTERSEQLPCLNTTDDSQALPKVNLRNSKSHASVPTKARPPELVFPNYFNDFLINPNLQDNCESYPLNLLVNAANYKTSTRYLQFFPKSNCPPITINRLDQANPARTNPVYVSN